MEAEDQTLYNHGQNFTMGNVNYVEVAIMNYIILACGVITVITLDIEVSPEKQICSYIFLVLLFCVPIVPLPIVTLVAITIVSKIITYLEVRRLRILDKHHRTEFK